MDFLIINICNRCNIMTGVWVWSALGQPHAGSPNTHALGHDERNTLAQSSRGRYSYLHIRWFCWALNNVNIICWRCSLTLFENMNRSFYLVECMVSSSCLGNTKKAFKKDGTVG